MYAILASDQFFFYHQNTVFIATCWCWHFSANPLFHSSFLSAQAHESQLWLHTSCACLHISLLLIGLSSINPSHLRIFMKIGSLSFILLSPLISSEDSSFCGFHEGDTAFRCLHRQDLTVCTLCTCLHVWHSSVSAAPLLACSNTHHHLRRRHSIGSIASFVLPFRPFFK